MRRVDNSIRSRIIWSSVSHYSHPPSLVLPDVARTVRANKNMGPTEVAAEIGGLEHAHAEIGLHLADDLGCVIELEVRFLRRQDACQLG